MQQGRSTKSCHALRPSERATSKLFIHVDRNEVAQGVAGTAPTLGVVYHTLFVVEMDNSDRRSDTDSICSFRPVS